MEGRKNAAGLSARREPFMRPTTRSGPKENKRRLARANARCCPRYTLLRQRQFAQGHLDQEDTFYKDKYPATYDDASSPMNIFTAGQKTLIMTVPTLP